MNESSVLNLVFLNQKVKSGIDFDLKFADRFLYQNRIAIDPDNFLIAIMGAITIWNSLIDLEIKIGDRFWSEIRWSIFVRKSRSDFVLRLWVFVFSGFSIADRFSFWNRWSILIWKSLIDFCTKIGSRSIRIIFWLRSWVRLRSENRWSIWNKKPGIDFSGRIVIAIEKLIRIDRSLIEFGPCGHTAGGWGEGGYGMLLIVCVGVGQVQPGARCQSSSRLHWFLQLSSRGLVTGVIFWLHPATDTQMRINTIKTIFFILLRIVTKILCYYLVKFIAHFKP
jgi:hypothetical protein